MCALKFHKDYSEVEFAYDKIVKAWQAINGTHSEGRYFFIGHLKNPIREGKWMAYLRRPDKHSSNYHDVPFDYEGFHEEGDADNAIYKRATDLGWRIREIEVNSLPEDQKNLSVGDSF
jgi:hypothetical protein